MGAGKTTLGKELAKALELEFVDLDHFIQSRYQKTVGEIFAEYGEEGFRKIESNLLKEAGEFENVVISTGGGTPCFFDNMDYMNNCGVTVYLKASPEDLTKRLITCREKRPLIKDKNDEELYSFVIENVKKREPFYSKATKIYEPHELISRDDAPHFVKQLIDLIEL